MFSAFTFQLLPLGTTTDLPLTLHLQGIPLYLSIESVRETDEELYNGARLIAVILSATSVGKVSFVVGSTIFKLGESTREEDLFLHFYERTKVRQSRQGKYRHKLDAA